MVEQRIGAGFRVEACDVETSAVVFDRRYQFGLGEAQDDLDVFGGVAMADGVGAGLLHAEHDIVDHLALGAVLAQVVAQALSGAQQV
jgi:hypothetical protein